MNIVYINVLISKIRKITWMDKLEIQFKYLIKI